jgi:hypothetical protein
MRSGILLKIVSFRNLDVGVVMLSYEDRLVLINSVLEILKGLQKC